MKWVPVLQLVGATVIAWALSIVSERLGRALKLVDSPEGPLKIHARVTPRFGGFAVIVSLWLLYLAGSVTGLATLTVAQLAVASLLFALGVWDDFRPRSAALRLVLQVMIFAIAWNLGVRVPVTGVTWLDAGAACVLFVVVINAVNFYDGMDGLLALTATCALGVWAAVAAEAGWAWFPAAAAAAVLLGFLPRNWHPARIFLGDGGSFVVGFLFYLVFTARPDAGSTVWVGLWVCAVPVCDAVAATIDRLSRGRNVLEGDRDHVYDILARLGLSAPRVALFLGLVAAVTARGTQLVAGKSVVQCATLTVLLYTTLILAILALRRRFRLGSDRRTPGQPA